MAYTNYGTIQTDILNEIGIDDADVEDVLEQALNDILQEICQAHNFSWLYEDTSFITTAPYSTGTITATEGSTAIVGSGTTFVTGMVGRKLRCEDATYEISAFTDTTHITLSKNYAGDGGSGLTYKIYQNEYSLASDAEDVISMRQENNPNKIKRWGIEQLDRYYPQRTSYGYPSLYAIIGYDSSGYMKVELYPIPNQARNVYYRYKKRVTEMSSDSDTPIIPLRYRWVLAKGGLYKLAKYLDMPDIAADREREYRQGIAQLISADAKIDERIVKGVADDIEQGNFLGSDYPLSPL